MVAALLDAFGVDVGLDVVEARLDESVPVVGDDLVEIGFELREGVGLYAWDAAASFLEKDLEEVAQSFFVLREFADGGVDVEPEEVAFGVVVGATLPAAPGVAASSAAAVARAGACLMKRECSASGLIWKASSSFSSAKWRVAMPFSDVSTFLRMALERELSFS